MRDNKPAPGWEHSLQPGDAVTAVLVTGDMSVSGMCTVTFNDGKNARLRPSDVQSRTHRHAHGQG